MFQGGPIFWGTLSSSQKWVVAAAISLGVLF